MSPLVSESLGLVFFALGSLFFVFREWFALRIARFLTWAWGLFSDQGLRSPVGVFPAASLPEFPRGIPPLVNPTDMP